MEKQVFCYVLLYVFKFCYGAVEVYNVQEKPEVHKCVANIIQRIELINTTDVTLINVNESLAMELHYLLEHPVRYNSRSFYWPTNSLYNNVYVIQCSDFNMFMRGLDLVKQDPLWNPRAKFVIIIEYIEDYLRDVSDFLLFNHIYDVAIVVYNEDDDVVVYTFGLERDECDRPAIKALQFLSRCSEIHKVGQIYDTATKTSLRGCHVKFGSLDYWPYISFTGKDAIEQFILAIIRQYEGITVDLVDFVSTGKMIFGLCLDNFTCTGMLHEIEINNVEGVVGGFVLTPDRLLNMDFIEPYLVDHDRLVIARAKPLGKWKAVLRQINEITAWTIFGTFCIVCVVVIHMNIFKKRVRDMSLDVLIIWGYFMSNIIQPKNTKTGVPYRLVLLNTLTFTIVITCAIQALLASATTQPFWDYQIDKVSTVVSKYQFIYPFVNNTYLSHNSVVDFTKSQNICKTPLDCMHTLIKNDDKALYTVASDIYHGGHSDKFRDEYGELKIYTISEPVATKLQTMYTRRGSSLVEPFNRLLLRLRSGGLIDKYFDTIRFKERLTYRFHARPLISPQSLKESLGVFMVLFCGHLISLISFIVEYLHYHKFK